MFTSSLPSEGKSDTTFAVAASFGSIGKKVLLIDGDIRKSVIVKRHEIQGNPCGLSQYLSGQKTAEEICYGTDVENLDIILAGPLRRKFFHSIFHNIFHNIFYSIHYRNPSPPGSAQPPGYGTRFFPAGFLLSAPDGS